MHSFLIWVLSQYNCSYAYNPFELVCFMYVFVTYFYQLISSLCMQTCVPNAKYTICQIGSGTFLCLFALCIPFLWFDNERLLVRLFSLDTVAGILSFGCICYVTICMHRWIYCVDYTSTSNTKYIVVHDMSFWTLLLLQPWVSGIFI